MLLVTRRAKSARIFLEGMSMLESCPTTIAPPLTAPTMLDGDLDRLGVLAISGAEHARRSYERTSNR